MFIYLLCMFISMKCVFDVKEHKNALAAGANPLGELTALLRPPMGRIWREWVDGEGGSGREEEGRERKVDLNRHFKMLRTLIQWRIQREAVRPCPPPPSPQSGHGPIQSDSLAINFEFDIRPREVRPSVGCFCLCTKQDARVLIDSQEPYVRF